MAQVRFRTIYVLGLIAAVAVTICAGTALHRTVQYATSTRTIVAMDVSGNKRIRLIQDFGGEPWDTKLYFDSGDGRWGFYYYEHEDWYWNEAELDVQGDVLHIIRDARSTIQLNMRTGTCIVDRADGWHREYDGPVYFETDTRNPILAQLERKANTEVHDQTEADKSGKDHHR